MKPCLVKLALISVCAVTVVPALAQTSAPPGGAAATASVKAAASVPQALTVATNAKGATLASTTTVTAAGGVVILSDGIVANTAMALVHSPAAGFVYER